MMNKAIVLLTLSFGILPMSAQARDVGDRTQTLDSHRARSETRIERLREDRKLDAKAQADKPATPKTNKKKSPSQ